MTGLPTGFSGLLSRWIGRRPPSPELKLSVVSEWEALRLVPDVRALEETARSRPGAISRWAEPADIPEAAMRERLVGRTAGHDPPPWHDGTGGAPGSGVALCRTRDAFHAPEFGAVILNDGRVLHSSVAEALYLSPTLAALPFTRMSDAGTMMGVPADTPALPAATVFVAWGGRFNYGHFLLDCLPALEAALDGGGAGTPPPIAPPLNAWQRDLLAAFFGKAESPVREIAAPLLQVGDLLFATPMDHFLHAPNTPLDRVRTRMLAAAEPEPSGMPRVYLSRSHDEKRRMVNEAKLEAELETRGFGIVNLLGLPLGRQLQVLRDAEVVVAPSGAALANCLFCRPDAKVFEIQPSNFTGIWARGLCHLVGADWYGYFAQSPLEETHVYLEGEHRPGVLFVWRVPLEPFLTFLDDRL